MTVAIIIASRGRGEQLKATIASLVEGMELEDTIISVALDEDDAANYNWQSFTRTKVTIIPRPDNLGSKYNAAYDAVKADLSVVWADDMTIVSPKWDTKLADAAKLFEDGLGVIYFGKCEGVFLPGVAVTKKFVDEMGFFQQPYTAFWFGETWIDEIARLCDRILYVNIDVKLLGDLKGKSRNVQEITFWAEFFDKMRPRRFEVASNIIEKYSLPWHKVQLRQRTRGMEQWLNQRNSKLRDPQQAAQLEKFYSDGQAVQDERYLRLKSAAQKMMDELK